MATTIWSNKQIYHWSSSGYIKIDASYDYYRSGADMYYTVSVTVKQTGSGSWFNDKVGCQIKLDGKEVYYNSTLKGTTTSSTKTWSRTAKVNNSRVANKTTGTTILSVRVWDSQGSADFDSTNTANLTVSAAMPILTVGTPSAAINYANFTITDSTGQTMTNYEIANSDGTTVQSGTLNSSSATIKFSEISGTRLSQGTKYSGYKIRAKNSIGWGNYVTIPDFTTVSLPNASTSGNFNIGNNTKITISSANYISAWSVSASDGSSTKTGTGSGTECTVDVGDSSYVNSMLANHPNDSSWTMTYVVHLYSDGVYVGYITVYNTCSIPSSSYNPTFTSDKVTYEDVNSAITSITGNNQKIIKGYSNVRFTIKPMTPGTGASASKYKVTANGTSQEAAHTGNNLQFTFNSVSSKSYSVQATDSRNKSTTVIGDYSTFIEYVIPSFATNNTKRTDQGIGSNVNINATFSYYNWSGLATSNTITEVKYKVGSGNWITIPTSDYTVANGTLSINHTTTGESFSQDTIYTITISVKDRLATREASIIIPSSQPLLWKDRLNKWLGIKKKPTCELDVDGDVSASGSLRVNGTSYSNKIEVGTNGVVSSGDIKTNNTLRGNGIEVGTNGVVSSGDIKTNNTLRGNGIEVGTNGVVSSGDIKTNGNDIILATNDSSTNHSGDILYTYGNGSKKSRIWMDDEVSSNNPRPNYESFDSSGNQVASGQLALLNDLFSANKILWGPDYYYMNGSQTINLSQNVSEQKNGIILVWQAYVDGEPKYYDFNYTFVPKQHILIHDGAGVTCWLSNSSGNVVATKYVYVYDNHIQGNNVNNAGVTNRSGSGIITNSKYWVLTYVLGV